MTLYPYERLGEGVELLAGRLFRFTLIEKGPSPRSVSLQLFLGLQGIAAELWEQEVRVLLRVSTLGHPALPQVLDGGHDELNNCAFVITEVADHTLADEGGQAFFRSRPADCMRQLRGYTES